MLIVYDTTAPMQRREIIRLATMAEARARVEAYGDLILFEEDASYPGCADAAVYSKTTGVRLFAIEPEGFKVGG